MKPQRKPFVLLLQSVFLLMMLFPQLTRMWGMYKHVVALPLFRTPIMLLGIMGTIAVAIYDMANRRQQSKPFAPPTVAAPIPPGAINQYASGNANPWDVAAAATGTVLPNQFNLDAPTQPYRAFPYASTRPAVIACEWYATFHQRATLYALFVPPLFFSLFFIIGLIAGNVVENALKIVAVFAVWFGFLLAISFVVIRKRYPHADTVRKSTAVLTSEGFYDILPEKQGFAAWNLVTDVRINEHGVFVFHNKGGNFVPRQAFVDGETAVQQFYQAAQTLWKNGGREWPLDIPPLGPSVIKLESPKGERQ